MRTLFITCGLLLFSGILFAGTDLNGTWQGILLQTGQKMEDGTVLYADFTINDGVLSGRMREETYGNPYYAVKLINGSFIDQTLKFKQIAIERDKSRSREKWCRIEGELKYDPVSGYLEGSFTSYDCKRFMGKIILYRADFKLSTMDEPEVSHIWFENFIRDYKDGLYAPEIREIERKNFVFEPIFFDFDRAEIRAEHEEFLKKLIHVVKGHSDLRIKVIGHTDADGTDQYNVELSRRRAESIIRFFVAHGLSEDRLEFDFKGEKQPADTNATPEGRQRNRRVDFEFI